MFRTNHLVVTSIAVCFMYRFMGEAQRQAGRKNRGTKTCRARPLRPRATGESKTESELALLLGAVGFLLLAGLLLALLLGLGVGRLVLREHGSSAEDERKPKHQTHDLLHSDGSPFGAAVRSAAATRIATADEKFVND